MTPEEKAVFDPIITKAKDINNALKQIRADEQFFAEAKAISDQVGVASSAPSAGGLGGKRISFKGMGAGVASKMVGEYGQKALAPSGAAVVAQEFAEDPIPLGRIATGLLDVLPVKVQPTAEYAFMRQGTRTNNAAVVADGAVKPTSVIGVTRVEQSLQVVAHLSEGIPRFWLVDNAAVEPFVDTELRYGLGVAVEAKIIADIAATSGIQSQAYSTSVLATVRKSVTKLEVAGYAPGAIVAPATSKESSWRWRPPTPSSTCRCRSTRPPADSSVFPSPRRSVKPPASPMSWPRTRSWSTPTARASACNGARTATPTISART